MCGGTPLRGDRLGWSGTLVLPLLTKLPADAVVIAGAVPPVDVTAIVVLPKIAVLPADAVLPCWLHPSQTS